MNPEEIKLNIPEPGLYIIKFGNLSQDREPLSITHNGNIDSVVNYLKARAIVVRLMESSIVVEEEAGKITLIVNEDSHFKTTIIGTLALHPNYLKWGINTDKQYSSLDLAQMIRMNRYMFTSAAQAMELVAVFQNLKAKIQKEVELSDDKRGNKTFLQSQIVLNMTIPIGFRLKTPIFKGFPAIEFEVEISINADTLNIQLVSPAVADIVGTTKANIISDQITEIEKFELKSVPILYC